MRVSTDVATYCTRVPVLPSRSPAWHPSILDNDGGIKVFTRRTDYDLDNLDPNLDNLDPYLDNLNPNLDHIDPN